MGFEIPLDVDYPEHPKTLRLIAALGKGADIYPIRLWCWCAKYAKDGVIKGGADELEKAVKWSGERGRCARAMVEAGFVNKDGKTVHDWEEHAGRKIVAYERKKSKQRAAYEERSKENLPDSAGRMSEEGGNSANHVGGILPTLKETKRKETTGNETTRNETQTAPPIFELSDEGLAQEFCFYGTAHVGMRKRDAPQGIAPMIGALVKAGISREEIRAEIHAESRDTNEWFGDFAKRLKATTGKEKSHGRPANPHRFVEGRTYEGHEPPKAAGDA